MSEYLQKCFSTAKINGLSLRNRVIKAATFEGMSRDGVPGEGLINFHRRIAQGGVAMTTIGYCSAEADGRVTDQMLYMDEQIKPQLQRLIAEVQQCGSKVSGQLSHCGNFSKNRQFQGRRPLGPSFGINSVGIAAGMPFAGSLSIAEIKERVQTFARAARFMKDTGFDAIEIHFGHGYGISQFISPRTNKRTDEYGGSLANRMRFALEVLAAVREAVGDDYPLLGKISMMDGVSDGIKIDDAVEIAKMLDRGGIDALVCSGGTSSMNPMLLFRGDSLLHGMIEQEKNPVMRMGLKMVGPKLFRHYPYEDTYFIAQAQRIRDAVACNVVYIGGCNSNRDIERVMAAGFDFVQLGRGLIYDPDFVRHAMADANYKNGCSHCNKCATLIEHPDGIRCTER
ncbi:2,4-dienoyl-CoA reductase-like NADH-dependent reductase (Old Yellow Enzyme family) [Sinobacterium caligoides]|uniref:2,4-dienoyl-CoA reductase-like NADH-dependent reductase (Old Yellow Enzyme family) n=1 Tax=Sinobacterium caligoides TaxID=933926 RepID=A0A3N2DPT2_9GAMM|nr:NADH:flavin oxidoreductase [Sinobacterium caligoides]ROS01831.1 2,4-dienoyl-CoA reductase-like NADH-dependent reductase (Old Yellow Enzyme family) [Sinobacterium caligoides]